MRAFCVKNKKEYAYSMLDSTTLKSAIAAYETAMRAAEPTKKEKTSVKQDKTEPTKAKNDTTKANNTSAVSPTHANKLKENKVANDEILAKKYAKLEAQLAHLMQLEKTRKTKQEQAKYALRS